MTAGLGGPGCGLPLPHVVAATSHKEQREQKRYKPTLPPHFLMNLDVPKGCILGSQLK